MPYDIVEDHPDCPSDKPWGVVKEDNGKLMGCHKNKTKAEKQIVAIYASESASGPGAELNRSAPMSEQQMFYTRALVDLGEVGQRQAVVKDLLDNPSLPVPFIASTAGVKSDGINLKMEDWDITRFGVYGPVMWIHNYWHPPLGTGTAELGKKLRVNVNFDRDDDFAMLIRGKAIKGMMAGSVGWFTTEDKKNELIEFSMCPMGLDPDALPDIKRMSPTALRTITEVLGEDDTGLKAAIEELRDEIMGDMKQLVADWIAHDQEIGRAEDEEEECDPETDPDCEPDEEMEEHSEDGDEDDIRILLPEVPEQPGVYYLSVEGDLLTPTTANGITSWATTSGSSTDVSWEDIKWHVYGIEPEIDESPEEILQRAGAVLSKKNRDDLAKALELIENVIARATPDDEFFASLDEEQDDNIDDGREEEPVEQRQEPSPEIVNQIKQVLEKV